MRYPHQRIRSDIEGRILSGAWPPGHRVGSEHELMAEYGCSRMTVNKVLTSLAERGLIVRKKKSGSVVATPIFDRAVLKIQDFALEAKLGNKDYQHRILRRSIEPIDGSTAGRTRLPLKTEALFLDTLHVVDGEPEALEERIVNLATVPEARNETFVETPPGTWLLRQVPWSNAEHIIRAVAADETLHTLLGLPLGAACLVLERRTWRAGAFITEARITYSGERHRFVGRFSPLEDGQTT